MPQPPKEDRPTPEEINQAYRDQYITVGEKNDKMRRLAKMNLDETIGDQGMAKTYFTQTVKHVTENWNELIDIASKHDPEKSIGSNLALPFRLMWREIQILMAPLTAFGEVNGATAKHWALDAGASPGLAKVIGVAVDVGSGFVPVGTMAKSFAKGIQGAEVSGLLNKAGIGKAAKAGGEAAAGAKAADQLAEAEKIVDTAITQGLAADGIKVAAEDTVRLFRGQTGAFGKLSSNSPLGAGERGRWFTTDLEAAKFHGSDLVYVDVPKAVADAAQVPDSLFDKTGRLLPTEWANKAQSFVESIPKTFWDEFNAIKKKLEGITEVKSFKMAEAEAAKLGITTDDIRALFPGQRINDIDVYAYLAAMGTGAKAASPTGQLVASAKAFDPANTQSVDVLLNNVLDYFNLSTQVRSASVTAGRAVKYHDQAPANKSINEMLRHWDSENMAKLDRTAAAQTMAEDILAMANDPGKLNTLQVIAADALKENSPTAWQKIREGFNGLLLLRSVTWTRQILGNSVGAAVNVIEKEAGAYFSISEKQGLVRGEGFEFVQGMRMAVAEASKAYLDAFRINPGAQSRLDFPIHQIGGAFGRVINFGSDNVRGIDNFFKTLVYNGEVWSAAMRDAVHAGLEPGSKAYIDYIVRRRVVPTLPNHERAMDIATNLTFQAELGSLGKKAQGLLQYGPLALYWPYVKSGINLIKWGWNRTPGLQMVSKSLYEDILAGGTRADMAIGRLTMSNIFGQFYHGLFQDGLGTGGGPIDVAEKRSWQAVHTPYSFQGPDGTQYSFANTVEPGTTPMEMYADFAEIQNQLDDMTGEQAAMAIALTVSRDVLSNTWWQNAGKVSELMGTLKSGESVNRLGSELLAAPLTAIATGGPLGLAIEREMDPIRREARSWIDGIRKGPFARVMGYDKAMPPLRDGYGDPILVPQAVGSEWLKKNGGPIGQAFAAFNNIGNPFVVKPGETDRIKLEGDRLQIKMPAFPWSTGGGNVRDDFDLRTALPGEAVPVPLTPEQRDRWIQIYRNMVRTVNGGMEKTLLDKPEYQNAPLALQRELFMNYLAKSRGLAKNALMVEDIPLAKSVAESSAGKYLPMLQPDERAKVQGDVTAATGLLETLLPQQRENLLKFGILDSGAERDYDMTLRKFSSDTPNGATQ